MFCLRNTNRIREVVIRLRLIGCCLFWSLAVGCSSQPSAINPVDIDPYEASRQALTQYDKNGDNMLSGDELTDVAGIAKYKKLYDLDGDDQVSQDEIVNRIKLWSHQGLGIRQLIVLVTLDGQPFPGADIEFVPENYLGPNVKRATGKTDGSGSADLAMAKEDMPAQLSHLPIGGVMGGTFKVKVTHPSIDVSARYNRETVLGEEIAFDTIGTRAMVVLKSK
ncbi:MAG: hypothetical protein ABGX16_10025 [Pirellulales bacterium]